MLGFNLLKIPKELTVLKHFVGSNVGGRLR